MNILFTTGTPEGDRDLGMVIWWSLMGGTCIACALALTWQWLKARVSRPRVDRRRYLR